MKTKNMIAWAAFFGFSGVILGALGAHALERTLTPDNLESFKTGVRYQVWHAIVLLILGLSSLQLRFSKIIITCFISGVILFSGSIYFLSTTAISGLNISFLGPVTPVGGLLLIIGWFFVFLGALNVKSTLS